MKRLFPATLKTFLQDNANCLRADLFAISLPTGETLYATEGQWDITILAGTPGWAGAQTTFKALDYGRWSRGKITSEATTKLPSNSVMLTCIPQPGTFYPGLSVGILFAALNHLFDGSTVWIYTAYMPLGGYGDVSHGIETKGQYTITKSPKLQRNIVQFECADPLFLLNLKVPSRLLQSNCPWSFCDSNCTLNAANYTVTGTAGAESNQNTIVLGLSQPDGYFTQGVITCTSGQNKGLSQTVKSYLAGTVTVLNPWVLPINPGDTFSLIKGCDKTLNTCANTNQANGQPEPNDFRTRFGGTPFVPPPSNAL